MTQQQVIVTQVYITKAGQLKFFQVKLPKNTKKIIGIETGIRLIKITKK
jgi:hypothetical protein